jgi:hypothetical protein
MSADSDKTAAVSTEPVDGRPSAATSLSDIVSLFIGLHCFHEDDDVGSGQK